MANHSNLIVIGGGPGGYEAAAYAASCGLTVTLFEEKHLGGTCLNVGCIPTKTLCHAAEVQLLTHAAATQNDPATHTAQDAQPAAPSFNFDALMERRDAVVAQLVSGVDLLLKSAGVTVVPQRAQLRDAHTVEADGQTYTADHIILATGSTPARLPIEGADLAITSDELLSRTDIRPRRLCIVGGGVIGMEIACAYQAFGVEVTVVEFMKECLPPIDADIAKRLRRKLTERGITFYLNAQVCKIEDLSTSSATTDLPLRLVHFEQKGKSLSVEADTVLMATGRRPNFGGQDLDSLGITYTRRGISVDDHMQTSLPAVYAIGDVNGRTLLAHAAKYQGLHAVNHILGKTDSIRLDLIPSAVFTNPEVASIGPTEQALKESGNPYTVHKSLYRANGKALTQGETDGIAKLLLDEDEHIVACHVMGPHAADLVQEVTLAINLHLTLPQLRQVVHIHPTLSEILVS